MENVKIGSVVYLNAEREYTSKRYFTVIGRDIVNDLYKIIYITNSDEVIELKVPAASLTVDQ